jgi:hypothetical protein
MEVGAIQENGTGVQGLLWVTPSGIVRLSVLAVSRLITSTNVVGWIIGKSAGLN